MLKFLAASMLLAFLCVPVSAQTVATCPTAKAGTAWASWLPCPTGVVYASLPLPASAIVSDLRGASASWAIASSVPATDQVWAKTAAVPAGQWVLAKAPNFALAAAIPPPPPPPPAPCSTPATLSWIAPVNADGSPAIVTGYGVYSGASPTALAKVASVGPTVLTYQTTICAGTTYFAVTATGESAKSAVVSKSQ